MRTKTINIYTIEEHPNQKACFEWIRANWHDLADYSTDDMTASLKGLAAHVNGRLDYSLSPVPDRGEFVRITDYNREALADLYTRKDDCPLTGHCYDVAMIEGLYNGNLESVALETLHAEGEYIYSDEGLLDMCEANGYEFLENGEFYY